MRSTIGFRAGLIAGVSMIGIALASPAFAQAKAAAADNTNAIEEIVVTAQRTAQSLQDVPVAVSAFTAEGLAKQQINNSADLQLTLPNITFTKSNFTGGIFTIRGVGDLCVGVTCDSATAIHINDLPLFGTRIFETEFMDLERVEVLRGPQGTLFGRNATAGVVNFITAKPDLKGIHASAEAEYGNYNDIRLKGMFNLPVTDRFGIRLAGYYLKRDGYTQNIYTNTKIDGRDEYALRGSARWEPTDNTTIDLMGYYFHEKDDRLRSQKQLCQRDPTGVLGCLPGRLDNSVTNFNSTFVGTLTSKEFLGIATAPFGAAASGAFRSLGLSSIYGPDAFTGAVNPSNPRQVSSGYNPTYFADEIQASIKIEHDFGNIKVKLSGLYQRDTVDSTEDYYLAVQNPAIIAGGLGTAQAYAAGAAGPAFAQIGTALKALIPNGPGGPFCTSAPETTGTGIFGGHSVCGSTPLSFDRSVNKNEAYTGEAIISSQFDGKFNFLLGAIYNKIKLTENSYYVDSFGIDYVAATLGLIDTLGQQLGGNTTFPNSYRGTPFYRNNTNNYDLKSYGIFGEAYFNLTDTVKVTAGLRYNNDKKDVSARTTLVSFDVPYGSATAFGSPYVFGGFPGLPVFDASATNPGNNLYDLQKANFSELTGRAVIDWKVTDENLLYASYSRGYKSGGINPPLSPVFAVPVAFTPEFIDSFEVGSKNTFLDGTLRLNISAFYYKYKGLQTSRIVARTSVNDNVDAAIYGLEADAVIQPVRALAVNMGFSYLHTKVTSDKFLSNPRDPSGGRSDAVIIKDITNGSNCAVVPTTAGNAAGANGYVGAINGGIGLKAPTAFPTDSGINGATGAFSICSALAGNAPTVGALFGGVQVLNEGVTVNIKGNQLPQAPTFKASAGIQYTIDFDSGMSIVPRFDIAMTGNSYGSIFNGSINRIPSYYIMNAQVQLNGKDDRFFVRAFISNIANNNAVTGQYVTDQSSGLFTNIFTLDPRRYGISVGAKF